MRLRRVRAVAVAAVTLVLVVAGCDGTGGGNPAAPTASTNPKLRSLTAKAGLAPCPRSGSAVTGTELPDLTLDCLGKGPDVTLSGLRGKPVIINVWASWCEPCRKEAPMLQRFHERAGGQVRVLGVLFQDSRAKALRFAIEQGLHYPSVVDPVGRTKAGLGVVGAPMTLLVTADGRIAYRKVGPISSSEELRRLVARHLGVRL